MLVKADIRHQVKQWPPLVMRAAIAGHGAETISVGMSPRVQRSRESLRRAGAEVRRQGSGSCEKPKRKDPKNYVNAHEAITSDSHRGSFLSSDHLNLKGLVGRRGIAGHENTE
jgi:hypothetical protein